MKCPVGAGVRNATGRSVVVGGVVNALRWTSRLAGRAWCDSVRAGVEKVSGFSSYGAPGPGPSTAGMVTSCGSPSCGLLNPPALFVCPWAGPRNGPCDGEWYPPRRGACRSVQTAVVVLVVARGPGPRLRRPYRRASAMYPSLFPESSSPGPRVVCPWSVVPFLGRPTVPSPVVAGG
jgi:hypothetical protein